MSLSASSGPQLPGGQGQARLWFSRTGSTTAQAASTASSPVNGAPSPVRASAKRRSLGLLLVRLRVEQRELTLVVGELLARPLDPGREDDNRVGREPETQIVGAALCRRGVGETYLLMFHRPRAQP